MLTIIGGLYSVFQWGKDIGAQSAVLQDDRGESRQVKYYGYFNDLDDKQKNYTSKEVLNLTQTVSKHDPKVELIEGAMTGVVIDEQGEKVERTWKVTGYQVNDIIVISYYTSSSVSKGAGSYVLRLKGSNYVGYWLGQDGITGKMIQAPYVLLASDQNVDYVVKKYPELKKDAHFILESNITDSVQSGG